MKYFNLYLLFIFTAISLAGCSAKPLETQPPTETLPIESPTIVSTSSNAQNVHAEPSVMDISEKTAQLKKIADFQERDRKKRFMLITAQDDLECFTWGGNAAYADIWKQIYQMCGYDGNLVMQALSIDLDTYVSVGDSKYASIWASGEYVYGQYTSGELKNSLGEVKYNQFTQKMNAIDKRLGVIFAKPEYAQQFNQ